jgi:hypothetical protein
MQESIRQLNEYCDELEQWLFGDDDASADDDPTADRPERRAGGEQAGSRTRSRRAVSLASR